MDRDRNRVCPVELAGSLDSKMRRWLQNPHTILAPFIREGMTALDIGCGPGFFSIEMAGMVGTNGRVIAADLQQGMLDKLSAKIRGTALEQRITLAHSGTDTINVSEPVDFILAFYMVHEIPDKDSFFKQASALLRPDGQFLLVEPKLFHVSSKDFERTTALAAKNGFKAYPGPKLLFSWSAVLRHG